MPIIIVFHVCFSDPLADYEDVIPLPIFGPSLTINGYAAQWKDSGKDDKSSGLNIRLNFQVDVGSKSYNTINITNDGTAAVYFSWKVVIFKFCIFSSAHDYVIRSSSNFED